MEGLLSAPADAVPQAATRASTKRNRAVWRDYFELTKPRVVSLIVLTAVVGALLASPGLPPLDA
jgi:protoheme IX farnesyltransferase